MENSSSTIEIGEVMKHFHFWQKWLLAITILVILFGILLIIPNKSELFDLLFNDRIKTIFWPDISPPPGIVQFQQWIFGVLGATMVGWGIIMAFIVSVPFRNGERWAWYSFTICIGSWYFLDTTISIIYQATFNAIFNTLILLLFLPPLIATYRSFHSRHKMPENQISVNTIPQ